MNSNNQRVFQAFSIAWQRNQQGAWPARWHRYPVWHVLAIQKLGLCLPFEVPLFWGERMQVLTGETISRGIIGFGYGEPAITALLCELVQPGVCTVDIGTHFGYEAMLMSALTGTSGIVHAFEPNPEVQVFARHNLAAYPYAQLHGHALSDQAGWFEFALPDLSKSGFGSLDINTPATRHARIELQTLDLVLDGRSRPVSVIKCDAEGHEEAILRGAASLVATDLPALVLETGMANERGFSTTTAHRIASQLAPLGYAPFTFDFNGELIVGPLDSFPFTHASTLYLHSDHSHFVAFMSGFSTSQSRHIL